MIYINDTYYNVSLVEFVQLKNEVIEVVFIDGSIFELTKSGSTNLIDFFETIYDKFSIAKRKLFVRLGNYVFVNKQRIRSVRFDPSIRKVFIKMLNKDNFIIDTTDLPDSFFGNFIYELEQDI